MSWTPSRDAASARLDAFLDDAGPTYARQRNLDLGPGRHRHVSRLSPWLRHRLLREDEVVDAVVRRHGHRDANAFLQEVYWRSYWKGWLERRPWVWQDYRRNVAAQLATLDDDPDLAARVAAACRGDTGIDCFDAWAEELRDTGYLHNHARMWFASIWIFTLHLPWALGADHFLRNLLDGDPASNTLSWRWVAGLHTPGKTYLARAGNIARFTEGRFQPDPDSLAAATFDIDDTATPGQPSELPPADPLQSGLRAGLLINEDDLSPEHWLPDTEFNAIATVDCCTNRSPGTVAPIVRDFTREAVADAAARAGEHWQAPCDGMDATDVLPGTLDWAARHGLEGVVIPCTPTGPAAEVMDAVCRALTAAGVRVIQPRCEWDSRLWPLATHGYFRFRKALVADRRLST